VIRYGKKNFNEETILGNIKLLSASGDSSRTIARKLNDAQMFSRSGKSWCFQTICRILAREKAEDNSGFRLLSTVVPAPIQPEDKDMIFVFGSNEQGRHGAGAARAALKEHGAIYGQGNGPQGQAYAIPTCAKPVGSFGWEISLAKIEGYIKEFLAYATAHPYDFKVTRIGTGFVGLTDSQIAPFFKDAPANCYFDSAWETYLGSDKKYWGTF
jgi:hypothetical protein